MRRSDVTGRIVTLGLAVAGGSTLLGGCVPQNTYDELRTAHRSAMEELQTTNSELDRSRTDADALRASLDAAEQDNTRLRNSVAGLQTDLDRVANESREAMNQVATMSLGPLPMEVQSALQTLARNNPGLVTFDADRGMLRFNSDVTFASGSDQVQAAAANAIASVASALTGEAASKLVVEVVGHTDNVPIGKPETKRNHPTNMHLSVHRAISVQRSLVRAGIPAARIKVAGYGEHRPVVANPARGGAAPNRRVEIYIKPADPSAPAAMMAMPEAAVAAPTRPTPAPQRETPIK